MKGIFLITLLLLLVTEVPAKPPTHWYTGYEAKMRIVQNLNLGAGKKGFRVYFKNVGHTIYIAEFWHPKERFWSPYIGGVRSSKSFSRAWINRLEDTQHFFTINHSLKEGFFRVSTIKTRCFQEYLDYFIELRKNYD